MRATLHLVMPVLLVTLTGTASAEAQVTRADYERALGLRDAWQYLTEGVADPAIWIEDSSRFSYRRTVLGGHEFVTVDADTLAREPSFDHERLAAALSRAAGTTYSARRLPFDTFRFADNGRAIEMTFDERWWRCRPAEDACEQHPGPPRDRQPRSFGVVRDLTVPADNPPRRSPDGRWEAFVQDHNVVVRAVDGGARLVLSRDGSEGSFYDPESIVWSPDSTMLAAYRVRPGYPRRVHYLETAPDDRREPRHVTELYVKPGDAVDIDHPVIFHLDPARHLEIANDLFPNPYTLSAIEWRQDSRAVTFEYNQRGHQVYRVIEVDAASGEARAVVSEEAETFVNYGRRFRHDLDDGREIIWMSERDGWNHLYLLDGATGGVTHRITEGEWVVRSVEHVDEARRQIWFSASGRDPDRDPYLVHYYRIGFDGSGLTALTVTDAHHEVRFSPDMRYYVDTYSRVDLPTVSELRRTSDGSLVAELERAEISRLLDAGFQLPEVFTAKGRDGVTDIWGIIMRPTRFDPSKTYPVIENIYAGPHDAFVPKTFWPFGPHAGGDKAIGMQAQAELGFVVVMIDGMGTMHRSKAFHDVAWRNLKDAGFPDRIRWHQAAAAAYPWYDVSRVGIYGGSAGGQSAMGALLFQPDFYHAAVAYAGCHDNRMDKISWNERWMGWPVDAHYAESSNVDNAWRLEGRLLLVVGELDTNVDPASTMQVVSALIAADKTFDLLVIPGGQHGAGRTTGPVAYGERARFDFFVRHLLGVEPPDWNGDR